MLGVWGWKWMGEWMLLVLYMPNVWVSYNHDKQMSNQFQQPSLIFSGWFAQFTADHWSWIYNLWANVPPPSITKKGWVPAQQHREAEPAALVGAGTILTPEQAKRVAGTAKMFNVSYYWQDSHDELGVYRDILFVMFVYVYRCIDLMH